MAKVFIKSTRPLQTVQQVVSHVKYVGFRSQETNEKGFFDKNGDNSDFKVFINQIEKNPALKHPKSIKAHKLIFSLRGKDYNAYKRSGKDYKDLVRKTLLEYENKHGVKLAWIANIHEKEGHPHCHVIIMGVSSNKDSKGRHSRIFFTKDDYAQMKSDFDLEFEKDVQYDLLERLDMSMTLNDIGKGFEQIVKLMVKDIKKTEHEAEQKKNKEISKNSNEKEQMNSKGKGKER